MARRETFTVLIAGGGVAALEAALALRELGEGRIRVDLLAPEPSFWYRPVAVAEPFGQGEVRHFDLGRLAEAAGAGLTLGALVGVDADRREARTAAGATLPYDALLIACGAVPKPVVPGALTFRGPADSDRIRDLLDEAERGDVTRIAFAVPWGAVWSLPAYELALMTAARLAVLDARRVEVSLVTPEDAPLQLFGRTASETVRDLLDEAGVDFVGSAYPAEVRGGELLLLPGGALPADRVVALPRLQGQPIDGIPQTVEGFIQVDDHCCVYGTDAIFAAGDITSFPVKQGGIAAQQALTAADAIAAYSGAAIVPEPFRPVLRGLLLTGRGPRYLRRELSGSDQREWASEAPIWWPPTKIVGRRLAPFLASLAGESVPDDVSPPTPSLPVEVALEAADVRRLTTLRPEVTAAASAEAAGRSTVGAVMAHDPLVVSPETTLSSLAAKMSDRDTGAALVVEDERLIGILTARDVLRALTGEARAADSQVRRWMTSEPVSVGPRNTLGAAEALMTAYGIHHLPVVEDELPVGMVGLRDVARLERGDAPTPRVRTPTRADGALFDSPPSGTLEPMKLPQSARALVESGSLAHLVTLNADGSPQVSCVWVGLDDDEIVSGHLRADQKKLRNVARDPRVALSIEGTEMQPPGLKQYLVLKGRARLVEGGAAELLQRLAHVYLGPEVKFPPMDDPPPGQVMRIMVEWIGGVGPWAA